METQVQERSSDYLIRRIPWNVDQSERSSDFSFLPPPQEIEEDQIYMDWYSTKELSLLNGESCVLVNNLSLTVEEVSSSLSCVTPEPVEDQERQISVFTLVR